MSARFSTTPTQIPDVTPDRRIPALDGIRACASLMVVLYHFGPHIAGSNSQFSWLRDLPEIIWKGVDLFFVLSGFLISSILLNSRYAPNYFKPFYVRRAFRILPLYFLILVSYLAVLAAFNDRIDNLGKLFENRIDPIWYIFFLQNIAMTSAASFGPVWLAGTWSLAVEEQFYLTIPACIRKLSERAIWAVSIMCLIGAPILRAVIQKTQIIPSIGNYVLLPTSVDALAAGMLVAMLMKYRYDIIDRNKRLIRWGTVGLAVGWIAYGYIPNPYSVRLAFIHRSAQAFIFAGFILSVLVTPNGLVARVLSLKWVRELGNMAYSTYLMHPILLCICFRMLKGNDPQLGTFADLVPIGLALLATLALSWLSWRLFEKPLLSIGHRWRYKYV
jgi:peptidoglycan/LPS O-acetylase OafA/YrhL